LLNFLADNTGSIFSALKISKYLKNQKINKNVPLILDYISFIENAFLINKVKRLDLTGKSHFEVGEKYYFEDIGLRNSIVGFRTADFGKIMENIVYLHLKHLGYSVSVGVTGSAEIDFAAEKNNEKIYVQVCYLLSNEETIEREFGNLLKIQDNYPKFVVSFDEFSAQNTYKGIAHNTLLEFLKIENF
jgi:predicted AAA+ superfamily ATPase